VNLFKTRTLYALGGLLALVALFYGVENWRGSRAWHRWQRERQAAGDAFDPAAYLPPPVAEADNFAAVPRVAAAIKGTRALVDVPAWPGTPLGNWREGRHADLEAFQAEFKQGDLDRWLLGQREALEDLAAAARRPACRVPVTYLPLNAGTFPGFVGFRAAGRVLQLRALVALRAGHGEAAFQDVATLLRLARHLRREPLLISQLLHLALGGIALQPLWEGLEGHAWTQPQLLAFQELLREDFLGSMALAWRMERAVRAPFILELAAQAPWSWARPSTSIWDDAAQPSGRALSFLRRRTLPRGWILQNDVRGEQAIQEILIDSLDPARHRIDPRHQDAALAAHGHPGRTPYTFLVSKVGQVFADQNMRAARVQAGFDQALVGCELERFRLASGKYPKALAELQTPLPGDVIDGRPLRYRLRGEGYVLYSVGWNRVDDGGVPGQGQDPLREGDWTWIIQH